jgi:hypothetical protein
MDRVIERWRVGEVAGKFVEGWDKMSWKTRPSREKRVECLPPDSRLSQPHM